jgi:hypothetical protein
MSEAPERIFLTDTMEMGVVWSETKINPSDTEYIRADLVPTWVEITPETMPDNYQMVEIAGVDAISGVFTNSSRFVDGDFLVIQLHGNQYKWLPETEKITHWQPKPPPPGAEPAVTEFHKARGVIPWKDGDELPEDTIRRIREGEASDE